MVSNLFKLLITPLLAVVLFNCSATNPAVDELFTTAVSLQKEKLALEREYLNILGHLQKFPNERTLRLQQGDLKKAIVTIKVKIKENRQQLDLSIKQWENAITEMRTEELLIKNEERKHGDTGTRRRRRRTR